MEMPPPPTGLAAVADADRHANLPLRSVRATRLLACAAHAGVPFFSVVTPLVVWSQNSPGTLPRTHARQAFSYQCLYLPIHIALTVLMLFGPVLPLLLCVALGIALEIPQMLRAIAGKAPLHLLPALLKA